MMEQFFTGLNDVQKSRFYKSVLWVVILLAVFLGVSALKTLKEFSYVGKGVYPVNTINVNGKGSVFAVPDTGSFSFSVVEEGKTVKDAQEKASVKINKIIDTLKDGGVEEKDIQTTGYNSYPKYEYQTNRICADGYCPPSKQVLTGYEVSQNITVKIRKTENAGDLLTKVGGLGVGNISGLSFVTDDIEKVQAEARGKAIADAKERAKILAKSLGVKLIRIVSFSENGQAPIVYGMGGMEMKAMSVDVAATPPQTPVGENEIVSNISITYEVE